MVALDRYGGHGEYADPKGFSRKGVARRSRSDVVETQGFCASGDIDVRGSSSATSIQGSSLVEWSTAWLQVISSFSTQILNFAWSG